jgi:C-terminal processing protease CtpA/Prc
MNLNLFAHRLETVLPLRASALAARLNRAAALSCITVCAYLLAGCGGSGGNGGSSAAEVAIEPSVQFQGMLVNAAPGAGALMSDWSEATCTDTRQKNWVRSWLNENYLFYRDAPLASIDPNTYTDTVSNLFLDYTVRGVPSKDRFSFVLTQAEADAVFQSGTATNVGFTLRRDAGNGNIIRIAYVDPNGPAAAAGFARGMVLATVDDVATSFSIPAALFDKLFNSPAGTSSEVGVQDTPGGPVRTLTVASATFASSPLIVDRVLPGTTTGYLAYNSFATPVGEIQLADAFKRFAEAGVTDLVVDLRYNGGGFIDIAAQLGYMVAGQAQSGGKVFETFVFNDKRSAENLNTGFVDTITGFFGNSARAGEPLSALNLQRVSVLTTGSTCSASESFISAASMSMSHWWALRPAASPTGLPRPTIARSHSSASSSKAATTKAWRPRSAASRRPVPPPMISTTPWVIRPNACLPRQSLTGSREAVRRRRWWPRLTGFHRVRTAHGLAPP